MNKNNLEKVDIDLADSELNSYFLDNEKNNVIVKIQAWNGKFFEFVFF